jgi:hypothetical protein
MKIKKHLGHSLPLFLLPVICRRGARPAEHDDTKTPQ